MAVARMKLVNIIGQYARYDDTIRACLDSGCYQPEHTADLVENAQGFSHINEENPYAAALSKISDVLSFSDIPAEVLPDDDSCYTLPEMEEYFAQLDGRLGVMHKERGELEKELSDLDASLEQLTHFFGLNVRLEEVFACKYVAVRFGRIPAESFEKLRAYTRNPYVLFFPCSNDVNYYWGMYVAPLHEAENIDRIFQSLFFERLWIASAEGTPEEAAVQLEARRAELAGRLGVLRSDIAETIARERHKCLCIYSYAQRQYQAYDARKYGAKRNNTFLQIGWVPEEKTEQIAERLDKVEGIDFLIENPEFVKKAEPPSELKNKRVFRPYEFFVKMYGLPTYGEIDPTVFVALTYTVLFGVMFADFGQGLVLSLIGFLMYKLKKMPLGKILVPCGISGAFFGLVFGSVFGFEEVLNPLYRLLGFGHKPFEVMENVNTILIASISIGVFLVLCAMGLNIYSCFKQRNLEGALFGANGVAGFSLYAATLTLAVLPMISDVKIPVLPVVLVFIAAPFILIYLREPLGKLVGGERDWQPESWGEYLTQGFFEMFEAVLSYVTNTVSFLRVGAFVLVHAGMMTTFTYLAELTGGGIPGALMMIFGNALVIALEGLLVGIQVLRLEFYEMFSRFFEGAGRPYEPLVLGRKRSAS